MLNKPSKIFFSGIGGSGMSAIAGFMADRGNIITGSDRTFDENPSHALIDLLKRKGITIVHQDGTGINSEFDLIVFSTAVEKSQPEYQTAQSLRLPIKTRPEYLFDITKEFKTIAVSGTSGKSTTSGLLAFLMHKLGLMPNFIGGGRVKNFKNAKNLGNSISGESDLMVIEACESDGTIVNYLPKDSILLNIGLDHHSIEKTSEMFEKFLKNTSGLKIVNADDPNIEKITIKNAVTFSIDNQSDYKAVNAIYMPFNSAFKLNGITFNISIPGKHNIYNSLSAIAMLSEMGIPLGDIANALPQFRGIERRFDIHLNTKNHLVIDDYAHNPHKISCLMQTACNIKEDICYIFQPHGYAPTKMMKDDYIAAFASNLRKSDHLVLLPIFYAGGTANKDISSYVLAEGVRAKGKSAEVVEERRSVLERLDEWTNYIVFGARDETLSDFTRAIARLLEPKNAIN